MGAGAGRGALDCAGRMSVRERRQGATTKQAAAEGRGGTGGGGEGEARGGGEARAGGEALFDDVVLVGYAESPLWVRVNPFVVSGYRSSCATVSKCVRSVWYLHNQTMNVWTHLAGTFVILALAGAGLAGLERPLSLLDAALVAVFVFAFASQFLLSAAYHAVMCHSAGMCFRFRQADYIGVLCHIGGLELVALVGFFVPPTWLGFATDRPPALVSPDALHTPANVAFVAVFGGVVTAVLVITVVLLVVQPERKYRIYVGMVLLTALSWALIWRLYAIAAPVAPAASTAMWNVQKWYAIGMVPFLYKVPERWIPTGLFDIWGASHQLWHLAIIMGTVNEVDLLLLLLT